MSFHVVLVSFAYRPIQQLSATEIAAIEKACGPFPQAVTPQIEITAPLIGGPYAWDLAPSNPVEDIRSVVDRIYETRASPPPESPPGPYTFRRKTGKVVDPAPIYHADGNVSFTVDERTEEVRGTTPGGLLRGGCK